jgi:hypothetical protein
VEIRPPRSVSFGMIRMSLQSEIDWRILGGAQIGAQQRRAFRRWRKPQYATLFISVNRELRRAYVP